MCEYRLSLTDVFLTLVRFCCACLGVQPVLTKWRMSNMPMSEVISRVIATHFLLFASHFTPFRLY